MCRLDSNQQRCLLSAVLFCRESGSRLVIGTTHLESGICDPANLRVMQLEYVLSRMDAYHLPCTIVAGDYNLRQWEAGRAKVRELKRTVSFHFVYALIGRLWELQGRLGSYLRDAFDTNHFLGVSSRGFVMSTVESGLADRGCCVQGRGLYEMGCVDVGGGAGEERGTGILPCLSRACVQSSPDVQYLMLVRKMRCLFRRCREAGKVGGLRGP